MRLSFLLALAVSLVAAAPVRAQSDDPPLTGTKVAGEIALGAVAGPVGFVGGGLATRWVARRAGAGEEAASRAAYWGAWTGMTLATAAAPTLIGTRGVTTGSYAAAPPTAAAYEPVVTPRVPMIVGGAAVASAIPVHAPT